MDKILTDMRMKEARLKKNLDALNSHGKQDILKCSCCQRFIEECSECHSNFQKDDMIICNDAETHFCDKDCFMDYCRDKVQEAMVE